MPGNPRELSRLELNRALLQRQGCFAEQLAAPATQRADVGMVVRCDLFEIVDGRHDEDPAVAAAQTLPEDTPQRSVLVLIAFSVAVLSLLLQGGTIGPLLRLISPKVDEAATEEQNNAERSQLFELMRVSGESVQQPRPEGGPSREQLEPEKRYRLAVIVAQRSALLDARDNGTFDADVLEHALANLDATQIAIDMRG